MGPKVSVILPTYNRCSTLSRSIDSVLNQTYDNTELLIIDDGSTDGSEKIVHGYDDNRIRLITHQYNRGGSAARNSGIYASSGKYLAFLDSDDSWDCKKIEKQVTQLESLSGEWIASYCDGKYISEQTGSRLYKYLTHQVQPSMEQPSSRLDKYLMDIYSWVAEWASKEADEDEQSIPDEGGEEIIKYLLSLQFTFHGASTIMIQGDIAKEIHGFDPRFQRHQDWEFLIRVLEQGKIAHLSEPLVTKYTGGNADLETITAAKELYFEKYDHYISKFDDELNITRNHYFSLGLKYIASRRRIKGMWYIISNIEEIDRQDCVNIISAFGRSYAQMFHS